MCLLATLFRKLILKSLFLFLLFILIFITTDGIAATIQDEEKIFRIKINKLASQVADCYEPPSPNIGDPEKYYWPKTLARFYKYGIHDTLSNKWVAKFAPRSPFHFTLVGMARIMMQYPAAPAVKKHKKTIINNVLKRTDSHNFFTAEGTENHINMARTSGYLYLQEHLKMHPEDQQAAMKMDSLENWIAYWSHKIYQVGTGEWNSSTYEVYNLLGWLNLFDFADKPSVRAMAKAVVDYYVAELALHNFHNAVGGSEMRGDLGPEVNASYTFCYLLFSNDTSLVFNKPGQQHIQSLHLASTNYRPAKALIDLGRKSELQKPAWFAHSKPSYMFETPSFVKQWYYVHNHFTLGAAVSPYGGYSGSTSQIVSWKLISTSSQNRIFSLSGNGPQSGAYRAKSRDPYTQFYQHKNVLFQLTRIPSNHIALNKQVNNVIDEWKNSWARDFSQRFPDETDKRNVVNAIKSNDLKRPYSYLISTEPIDWKKGEGGVQLAQYGNSFLALYPIADQSFVGQKVKKNDDENHVWVNEGQFDALCGFVLMVFDPSECRNLDELAFLAGKSKLTKTADQQGVEFETHAGDKFKVNYGVKGQFEEAIVDWGFGTTRQHVTITSPPFLQPKWPSGEGYGKMPEVIINEKPVKFNETWPVFSGPWITLEHGKLVITGKSSVFEVDYSGQQPFSSEFPTVGNR